MTLIDNTSIIEKYHQALNAIGLLEEEIKAYSSLTTDEKDILNRRTRNSLIKTYDFTYEIFWQTLYTFLENVEGLYLLDIVPIQVFRAAQRAATISIEEFYALNESSADKYLINQAQIDSIAIEIAERIPTHYQVMKKILDRINPSIHSLREHSG
jgi:hypothetical protein